MVSLVTAQTNCVACVGANYYWCPTSSTTGLCSAFSVTFSSTCGYGLVGSPLDCGTLPAYKSCATCAGGPGYWCATSSTCFASNSASCTRTIISSSAGCPYSCSAGYYNTNYGLTSTSCVQCPSGTTSPAGSTSSTACISLCVDCVDNLYKHWCPTNPSSGSCLSSFFSTCANGLVSSSSICGMFCKAGEFIQGGACVPCGTDTYSGGGAITECLDCPFGKTSPSGSTSAAACVSCPAGQKNSGGSCSNCPLNTYSSSGASSCTSCPDGQVSPAGSSSCVSCSSGQLSSSGSCVSSTTLVVQPLTGCPLSSSSSSDSIGGNSCIQAKLLDNKYFLFKSCNDATGLTFGVYSDSSCSTLLNFYTVPVG